MQNSVGQQNIQQYQTAPMQQPIQNVQQSPQTAQQPVVQQSVAQPVQNVQPQGQNVQVPNYSGVNIQIFNPSVATPGATAPVYNVNAPNYSQTPGCYPSNYYTTSPNDNKGNVGINTNKTDENSSSSGKKTEKRDIVVLTDDYIKNLENYLNSQDKEIRMMGAKEVFARLDEDHSRRDDKALNALINKMLQDPYTPIRVMALTAINTKIVSGDNFTVQVLQQMRDSKLGYGQDALDANNALLKMSGQIAEKEFEVKNENKTEKKSEKGK